MAEIVTTKPLNLYQLGQEMGGSPQFRRTGPDVDGNTKLWCSSTQPALDAAVAAHVANPNIAPPPSPEVANEATIRQQVGAALVTLQAIIDTPAATFGNIAGAQTSMRSLQAQVKDLARIQRRLIRLVVGDFTGTD